VVIDIVLPAMLGLVLVREAGVEAYISQLIIRHRDFDREVCTSCEEQMLASCHFFRGTDSARGAQNIPVTNLKGLVSRSPSDMFAIVLRGLRGEGR
jgi:hypothetical protein